MGKISRDNNERWLYSSYDIVAKRFKGMRNRKVINKTEMNIGNLRKTKLDKNRKDKNKRYLKKPK